MFIRYDREDGSEPQKWEFTADDLYVDEATAIEHVYGESQEVWLNALRINEAKARKVLIWHLLRQEHPHLPFKDVPRFRLRQVKVEMSVAELRELHDQVSKTKMPDADRERFEAAFERDIADAMARETGVHQGEIVAAPKAD